MWTTFLVKKPEVNRLVLIKITSFHDYINDFDPRECLFMGHSSENDSVYVINRIDKDLEVHQLGWKAHKDHDFKDMFWYKN